MSSAKIMKALLLRRHGGLDGLEVANDYPAPAADDGHVVIRVRASSFNSVKSSSMQCRACGSNQE